MRTGFTVCVQQARGADDPGAGTPLVQLYGKWPDSEFSCHHHRNAILLVFGHCLATAQRRTAEFAAAANRGDFGCVADWPGSYTAIIVHKKTVTAYSDLAGQFPIYYTEKCGQVLAGSDPAVLAVHHQRQPDPVTAAIHIACPAVLPLWSTRTPYFGVERLPGGGVLWIYSGRAHVDSVPLPLPVPGRTLSEGAGRLRAALADSVHARCGGQQVSSDFSGGLDSTSIAFLAAGCSQHPVTSVVYHQPLAPAADLYDATRHANLKPHIRLAVVRGTIGTLPFCELADALRDRKPLDAAVPPAAEPSPGLLASRRSLLRLAAASSSGSQLHLTGEGGDAVLMSAPSYLASLARPGSVHTLLRHCGAYARLRYLSPTRLASQAVRLARTAPDTSLHRLAAELNNPSGRPADWPALISWWPPTGEAAGWLTPRMRRCIAEIAADPATARTIPAGAGPADLAALTDLRRSGEAQRHLRELARPSGLPVHAPFLDSAVIRAALSVPAATRADPWSYKPLLRSAMRGLVPDEVFRRRTKGDYSGEAYYGAREASGALRALLRDSRLAALGVIEPAAAGATLDRMVAGIAVPLGPLSTLLATEVWLRAGDHAGAEELMRC